MKRILIVAAALLFAASQALAADLPVRAGPAPAYYPVATVYDWGGGYIGVNAGYASGQSNWSDTFNPSGNTSTGSFNVNGALAGVTAGVSGQWSAFVFGIEGDFDWQGLTGSSSSSFCTSIITSTATTAVAAGLSCKTESTWIGTLRARAGYAWDRVLLYGTAGIAGANVQVGLNGQPRQTIFQVGWTAGGGLEWAFAENWTAKVEYLFVDYLGTANCNHGYSCGYDTVAISSIPAAGANIGVKLNENLIRFGVNFKFGH